MTVLAQHSANLAGWGTPAILRRFCGEVLRPAALSSSAIDCDFSTSKYWQNYWPEGMQPTAFLDGSDGRDVLLEEDRHRAVKTKRCGSGFENAPGLNNGKMIQCCWKVLEADHRSGWLDALAWVGFSLESFASLQHTDGRNPLSIGDGSVITVIPARRIPYDLAPDEMLALLIKRQGKRRRGSKLWKQEQQQIDKIRQRSDEFPIKGPAPTHASYVTFLMSHSKATRQQQLRELERFLKTQRADEKSRLRQVEILGRLS